MKLKTIQRREWRGIYARSYAEKRFDAGGIRGIAGLIHMLDAQDFCVRSGEGRIKITGKGYSWLELAPEGKNVWATVMFDDSGRLFQCYFDITAGNTVMDGGKSHFEDLYLDVVARADSDRLYFYDEDELESAYASGEIDANARAGAYAAREELKEFLNRDKQRFFAFCRSTRQELIPDLKALGF